MRAVYFIGIPMGVGNEHLTLKHLGRISDDEVRSWARQLDYIAGSISKFPVKSEGIGILGYKKPNLVDFVRSNPRVEAALDILGNAEQTLHVTNHGISSFNRGRPINTGPLANRDEILAEEIHIYKAVGHRNYQSVYHVKLRRRTPITWLADKMGLSKFAEAEMNKDAGIKDIIAAPGRAIGHGIHKGRLKLDVKRFVSEAKKKGLTNLKDIDRYVKQKIKDKDYVKLKKQDTVTGHALIGTSALGLGAGVYNAMNKSASAAPIIEGLIGAGVGSWAGARVDKDNPTRGRVIGAVAGALGGPAVGSKMRSSGVKKLQAKGDAAKAVIDDIDAKNLDEFSKLHAEYSKSRWPGKVNKVPGYGHLNTPKDLFDRGFGPQINQRISSTQNKQLIDESVQKAQQMVQKSPFGIGRLVGGTDVSIAAQKYSKPYKDMKLHLEEDVVYNATNAQKRAILKYLRKNPPSTQRDSGVMLEHLSTLYGKSAKSRV